MLNNDIVSLEQLGPDWCFKGWNVVDKAPEKKKIKDIAFFLVLDVLKCLWSINE